MYKIEPFSDNEYMHVWPFFRRFASDIIDARCRETEDLITKPLIICFQANLRFAEWFCCAKVCSAKIINLCQQIKYNKGQWSRTVLNFRKWVRPVYIFCPARPVDPGPE